MSTLAVKLGSVFVKQLSKPFASQLTKFVLAHPGLRNVTVQAARNVHQFNQWVKHYGEGKTYRVGEMVDDKAVALASNMISETVIYSVAAGTAYWEYQRSVASSEEKKQAELKQRKLWEEAAERQRQELASENARQFSIIESMSSRLDRLEEALGIAEGQQRKRSWWGSSTPPKQRTEKAKPD